MAVTVVVNGTVAALTAVVLPLLDTSADAWKATGALPVAEPSISRTVRPPGVPFQLPVGRKSMRAVDGRMIAVVSERPVVGMVVQVAPPSVE
jgi:hypothetical protein